MSTLENVNNRVKYWQLKHIKLLCLYHLSLLNFGKRRVAYGALAFMVVLPMLLVAFSRSSVVAMSGTKAALFKGTQISTGGTDLNVGTGSPTGLSWNSSQEYDSTYYSYSGTNNTRLVVDTAGDYFFSVTVPITSNASVTTNRNAIQAEIRVNGSKQDVGVGRSSYIRNSSSHLEGSAHLTAMLSNLSVNDYVEVFIVSTTSEGTNTLTSNTHSLYAEYVENETVYYGTGTQTTNSTNFNQATAYEMEWSTDTRKDTGYTHSTGTNPEDLTFDSAGSYFVSVNIPLGGAVTQANVKGKILLDGSLVSGGIFQQGYIRNSNSHVDGSIHYSGVVTTISASQVLSVSVVQEANTGTITVDSEKATIYSQQLPTTGVYHAEGTQLEGGGNDWNPSTAADVEWSTDSIIDTDAFTHSTSVSSNEVTVDKSGDYMLAFNSSYTSTCSAGFRCAPKATVRVNDTLVTGLEAKSGYIRNNNGHSDSSNSMVVMLEGLSADDKITVQMEQGGNTGTVDDEAPATLLIWKKSVPKPVTQSTYRWYNNSNSVQPGGHYGEEGEPFTFHASSPFLSGANSDEIRLRLGLTAGSIDMDALSQDFKLQYTSTGVSDWYDTNWSNRRKITLDNSASSENLTDFPAMVKVNSTRIDYSKTQNSGQDIRFTDSDGTTLLKHEIETWNESGDSFIWVKVPQIDSGSTTDHIYMYYGNGSASDGQDAASVWSNGYVANWHMAEDPSISTDGECGGGTKEVCDSVGSSHADASGSFVSGDQIAGQVNGGLNFDGNDEYLNVASTTNLDSLDDEITISTWVSGDTLPSATRIILHKGAANDDLRLSQFNGDIYFRRDFSTNRGTWVSNTTLSTGTLYHISVTYDSSSTSNDPVIYINGSVDGASEDDIPSGTVVDVDGEDMGLASLDWGSSYWDGKLDEMRLSNVLRSADWIEAEYLSMDDSMSSFGSEEAEQGWYDTNWSNRRKITLDNSASSENLTDFPIMVKVNSTRIDYTKTQNSGQDIRFTDSDGVTPLKYEIEEWNESGDSFLWVKVPQIDSGSTTDQIYMYYGNSSASDGQDAAGVWSNGYVGVWHLAEDPSISTDGDCGGGIYEICDSTSNDYDGNMGGVMTSGDLISAIVNGGYDFDGNDRFTIDGGAGNGVLDDITSIQNLTLSTWLKRGNANDKMEMGKQTSGANAILIEGWTDGSIQFHLSQATTAVGDVTSNDTNWHYASLAFDGSQTGNSNRLKGYLDGAAQSLSYTGTIPSSTTSNTTTEFEIGGNGSGEYSNGQHDEVRLSDVTRSADWIEADYLSMNDAMNSYDSEVGQGPGPQSIGESEWIDVGGSALYSDWYNSSWSSRRQITLDNSASGENLTDFPILVKLNSSRIDYSKTQNSGQDIRFTDSDGTTELDYEIEKWNESGDSFVWVKVPQIDSGSTTDSIYVYYGNSSASDAQYAAGVWSNNYELVYHMNQNPGGTAPQILDSTSNNRDATSSGTMTSGDLVTGAIGDGIDFDGTNDYLDTNYTFTDDDNFTIEAWGSFSDRTGKRGIFSQDVAGQDGYRFGIWDGYPDFWTQDNQPVGSNGAFDAFYNTQLSNNSGFHSLGGTVETCCSDPTDRTGKMYYNGTTNTGTMEDNGDLYTPTADAFIGRIASEYYEGVIDEVRLASVTRSVDWMEASFESQDDNMNTFGSEQVQSYGNNIEWDFYDNSTPTDGANITTNLLSAATVLGSYVESNPSPLNPNAITSTNMGEWDFSLDSSSASAGVKYYFRVIPVSGDVDLTYSKYPTITFTDPPNIPTMDSMLRGGGWFNDGLEQPKSF